MSRFRFIHSADLHLGSPFHGLSVKDPTIASVFIEASRNSFSSLVSTAIELAVDFFVIAGDVYDGDWKDNKIGLFFNREMAKLERAGIPVFLLRGNHDALSVITKTITLPANVHEFPTNKAGTFKIDELKVALHGQGFAERSAMENLAIGYPAPVPGWFNIGVLHTSLTGRELHAPYAPCSVEDLRSRGYDYWALGHVHEFEEVASDPLVVFPGNLQGRNIRETGAKGAVLVTVEDGRPRYERVIVDGARFDAIKIFLDVNHQASDVLALVEEAARSRTVSMEGRVTAVRIHIGGESDLRRDFVLNKQQWRDELQAACHRAHADLWVEKIEIKLSDTQSSVVAPQMAGIDLEQLLNPHGADNILDEVHELISTITLKLPGGAGASQLPLDVSPEALIDEARQLLLARTGGAS
ncbi:serine/threonine protein phosphatase [Rhizobium sp. R72]|uniref:metallophosphoesterase family protein n=1 Tax=unclassified Rhizobium TaxID=2613769 RepID=UPI000B533138|nr:MULTISPECIES: DNA repair exonuclease [unclassified Rhizobium]OWW04842.1 serine/threonine protein phosphatase [Rhizobium sp. R72]OWW05899.1 serine/threonine protein phosphatase [Rhizobium sp. R711]